MASDHETFAAALRLRLAAASLDDELLGALATHGRMSGDELRDLFDATTGRRERSLAPPQGALWLTSRRDLREHITPWLESRRRVGLVVGEAGAVTATGIPVVEPEWRLTDAGVAYLQTRSEEKRLVPRVVLNRLGAVAVDGLTTAMKTAIAAFPALVLAWMVGLIRDPSPIGFSAAAALFAGVAGLALARARAVSLANAPALREVLRAGGEFAQELEASNRNWGAYLDDALLEAERGSRALEQWQVEWDAWVAKSDQWVQDSADWDQTDPATRGPRPIAPEPPVFPSQPSAAP